MNISSTIHTVPFSPPPPRAISSSPNLAHIDAICNRTRVDLLCHRHRHPTHHRASEPPPPPKRANYRLSTPALSSLLQKHPILWRVPPTVTQHLQIKLPQPTSSIRIVIRTYPREKGPAKNTRIHDGRYVENRSELASALMFPPIQPQIHSPLYSTTPPKTPAVFVERSSFSVVGFVRL